MSKIAVSNCSSNKVGYMYSTKDFKEIYDDPNFNKKKPTVLYIHGFIEDRFEYTTQKMVEAFEKNGGYNFLSCDWGTYSKNLYFLSVLPKLFEIGKVIANHLGQFLSKGYSSCQFHLVGHSLGNIISKICQKYSNLKCLKELKLVD